MKPRMPLVIRGGKKTPDTSVNRSRLTLQRTGLAVATIAILSVLLSMPMLPSKVSLKLGDTSPQDIRATKSAQYRDTAETELRRMQAAAAVGKVYDAVPNATDQAVGALRSIFHIIEGVRSAYPGAPADRNTARVRKRLGPMLGAGISDAALQKLLTVDADALREIEDHSLRLVSSAMSREIREDPVDVRAARRKVAEEASGFVGDKLDTSLVGEIAQDALRPNQIYDEQRTLAVQEDAREKVQPVYRLISPGDVVIAKGEQVQQEHMEKFEALGLRNPMPDYRSVVSLTLLVMVAVLLVTAYLARYHPEVYSNSKTMMLLAIIVVISTFALRVGGSLLGINLSPIQVGYFGILWVVTAGMLLAVLVNAHVAVLITALLSVVLSLMLNNELRYMTSAFMTALIGIYSVANIRDRNDSIRAMGLLAGTGVLLVWIVGGVTGDPFAQMLRGSVWAIGVAMAATWLFWIGSAFLEGPFGRTTHISLLELADTNKPLLRRLVMEAPGTYTHSVAAGYLAETAAEAIDADPLVARVASYYHDIGKIRRPHFFVENQHMENIHDHMNPTLSALVITAHIKDGVEIAREFRLPRIVQDVIVQHHGTSLVQYFYNQATGEQDPCTALEQQFRYAGPKPQTKEAGIVMLADSVEAASRSIAKPTPAKIEMMVNQIVADKLRDGQLDESDLTFREISAISDSFVRALTGTLHARIDYPDAPVGDIKRLSPNNGDTGPKLAKSAGETPADQEPGSEAAAV